jgi:hypothetical protein
MAACIRHLPPDFDVVWSNYASFEQEPVTSEYQRTA